MVDRHARVAVFRQIAQKLRDEIESGTLPPGAQVPTENQMMADYGVARMTARQAIAELRQAGLVISRQGRGTFVVEPPPVTPVTRPDDAEVHTSDHRITRHSTNGNSVFTVREVFYDINGNVAGWAPEPEPPGECGSYEELAEILTSMGRSLGRAVLDIGETGHPVARK